ncbi:hypothetical protein [Brevibacillus reuszeri]|uniref:hypothetical protein n=1 Tax=Brevibacillus reuszeri TaxID=54915 RepID=UPI003D1AC401
MVKSKSYKPILLLLSLSLEIVGCSDTPPQREDSQIQEMQDHKKEQIDEQVKDVDPISDENSKDLDPIVKKLAIGQSVAQVQEMFGKKYEHLNDADTKTVYWRYDFTQNTDYKFPEEKTWLQDMNVDVADLDSLRNGVIDSQLFIKFDDENTVSSYSYYYKGNGTNIKVRHMFEDGTIKEEGIGADLESMNPSWLQDDKAIELDERKYIVHDGFYYVPIDEEVNEAQLDTILGTVTRIGEWEDVREGDTVQYIPGTKYYSIKGIKDKDKIAIEILWHTIYEHKILKHQVMERRKPILSVTPQHGQ